MLWGNGEQRVGMLEKVTEATGRVWEKGGYSMVDGGKWQKGYDVERMVEGG